MERRLFEPIFFLVILVGTSVIVFLLFRPFLYTLVLAGILAYLTNGLYTRLLSNIKYPSVTAAMMTFLVFIALLLPLTFIGLRIVYEASDVYSYLSERATQERIADGLNRLQVELDSIVPGVRVNAEDITRRIGTIFGWLVGNLGSLLSSFASLALNFLFLLLFYYYLVRDGHRIKERLKLLSPMANDTEEQIITRVGLAVTATVRGSLVIALLQGLVAGLGFIIFGFPNPALWGSVVVIAAFIPTIGTSLVLIPAVLYLFATGHEPQAVGLAIWGSVAVGLLDNVLGPLIMTRRMRMHPLVILLSILGGVVFYGPLGVLLGPITVSLLYALLDIYMTLIRGERPISEKRTKTRIA